MPNYHAYLVRLWRDDRQQPWRAELVSPHTGETIRFATAEQLFGYLRAQMEEDEGGRAEDDNFSPAASP